MLNEPVRSHRQAKLRYLHTLDATNEGEARPGLLCPAIRASERQLVRRPAEARTSVDAPGPDRLAAGGAWLGSDQRDRDRDGGGDREQQGEHERRPPGRRGAWGGRRCSAWGVVRFPASSSEASGCGPQPSGRGTRRRGRPGGSVPGDDGAMNCA